MNIKEKIEDFYYHLKHHYVLPFIRRIKIMLRWIPIIWKDYDWDWYPVFLFLEKKLEYMADYHEKHQRYKKWEHNVKRMRTAARLSRRLRNEYYVNEFYDYFDLITVDGDQFFEVEWENFDDYLLKYPNDLRRAKKTLQDSNVDNINNKKQLLGYVVSDLRDKKAQRILFKILNQELKKWWD